MHYPFKNIIHLFITLVISVCIGCTSYKISEKYPHIDGAVIEYSNNVGNNAKAEKIDNGMFIPDGKGGSIWIPGSNPQGPNEAFIQAQELRLKVRELASQLLDTQDSSSLIGLIALPTSFVNLNNFSESSPLGRYMSEAMIYEFNQRGFPIKEYRIDTKISMSESVGGEFSLQRNLPALSVKQQWAAILVGTYLRENNAVFINVRLVRAKDGMVLRTAQIVLPQNALLSNMISPPLSSGILYIGPQENNTSISKFNPTSSSQQEQQLVKPSVKTQLAQDTQEMNNQLEQKDNNNNNNNKITKQIQSNSLEESSSKATISPPVPGMPNNL
ncbi:hypothetical protein BW722_01100 [Lawsonia intracellularis]|uniref:FlgO family outer membrane protein n=1 Tax=Lawsonia intracellularis TaxID=29546 RepID=UPI0009768452|nr:FlgO family outer membrane protein [Lawsonia intracellularis]OMQ05948.1 hypothetical protein BW722_01100 [Lawsonia intracellularis]